MAPGGRFGHVEGSSSSPRAGSPVGELVGPADLPDRGRPRRSFASSAPRRAILKAPLRSDRRRSARSAAGPSSGRLLVIRFGLGLLLLNGLLLHRDVPH